MIQIFRYRELLLTLIRKNTPKYKLSVLGPAWAIFQRLVLMGMFTLPQAFVHAGGPFSNISVATRNIVVYGPIEITFDLDKTYENPFNAYEVDVVGVLTFPNGSVIRHPAFYYQDFVRSLSSGRQILERVGTSKWCLRFSPPISGSYGVQLELRDSDRTVTSEPFEIYVSSSLNKGPLRTAPDGSLTPFRFEDGLPFFAIGHNIAWSGPASTYDYDSWFKKLAESGGNFTRVWMTQIHGSAQSLEWNKNHLSGYFHGVGRYSLEGAWNLDYIIRLAWESGIQIQLVLQHHGQFSVNDNPIWSENPYNVSNGGFLSSPDQFFVDDRARALFKRKIRYIVARWGAFPNIIWELFNEVNATTNFNEAAIAAWHQEMGGYIKELDYMRHLVTTSSDIWHSQIWNARDIDLVQLHLYSGERPDDIYHAVDYSRKYGKPVVIGEYSLGPNLKQALVDSGGIALNNTVWAAFMAGSSAMSWWWDNYIDPLNLYYHYRGLSAFLRNQRWDGDTFRRTKVSAVGGTPSREGLTIFPNKYLWGLSQTQFIVQSDGSVENVDQLSANLRPVYQTQHNTVTFHVSLQRDGNFVMDVAEVEGDSAAGFLRVDLDEGRSGAFQKSVALGSRVVVPVPPWTRTITATNTGFSRLRVGSYKFEGVTVSAAEGVAVLSPRKAYLWLKDRSWWHSDRSHGTLGDMTIRLSGLLPGNYRYEFWDALKAEKIGSGYASTSWEETVLSIPVPPFEKAVAVKVFHDGLTSTGRTATPILQAFDPYPNPSNASVKIPFYLALPGFVEIRVYDLLGRSIGTAFSGSRDAGAHSVPFDASRLVSGIYHLWITSGDINEFKRLVVVR